MEFNNYSRIRIAIQLFYNKACDECRIERWIEWRIWQREKNQQRERERESKEGNPIHRNCWNQITGFQESSKLSKFFKPRNFPIAVVLWLGQPRPTNARPVVEWVNPFFAIFYFGYITAPWHLYTSLTLTFPFYKTSSFLMLSDAFFFSYKFVNKKMSHVPKNVNDKRFGLPCRDRLLSLRWLE